MVEVPPGFAVSVFAEGLNGPRFISFGPDGTLYAADRGNDRIVALPDVDGDGVADDIKIFAEELDNPHSLVYHEEAWYVGVPTGVVRLQDTDGDAAADSRTTLIDDIPSSGFHRTRTVEFLPDGRMVLSVGSSCNVCEEDDPRRAAIIVYDGSEATGERLFATGLRNAVGLAIHPESGELWATNNGRDLMGEDLPPDTIHIVEEGGNYGWPGCHSGRIIDPDLGSEGACDDIPAPVIDLQAHSAPLGLAFYPGGLSTAGSFPGEYQGDLFIAYHGSWNRSEPTGYKVVRLPLAGSEPAGPVEDFAIGWLDENDGTSTGRPVGLAVGPDGALYVSDDKGDTIYRISYEGSN
jgi:glucose/arabinose dehydrogenase